MSSLSSFSETQLKVMALTPKCAAALSIPGSLFIVYESILDYRQHQQQQHPGGGGGVGSTSMTAMHRALIGMSVVDIISSTGWFLSTWMAPVESGALYAAGNAATCSLQGFLLQIAIGAPLYNGALILFYLLVLKYNWSDEEIFCLEKYIHLFIWIWCMGSSVAMLVMDLFHFIGPVCWISDPPECSEKEVVLPDQVKCNRAKTYSTALFCIPLWICIALTAYGLVDIYWTVKGTMLRLGRYNTSQLQVNSQHRSNQVVRKVALRALLYSIAFIITWTASTIWSVAQWFDYFPFWISYLWTLMEPLQGLWNCLIFVHNRPQSQEKIQHWLRMAIMAAVCCGPCLLPPWRLFQTTETTPAVAASGGVGEFSPQELHGADAAAKSSTTTTTTKDLVASAAEHG